MRFWLTHSLPSGNEGLLSSDGTPRKFECSYEVECETISWGPAREVGSRSGWTCACGSAPRPIWPDV